MADFNWDELPAAIEEDKKPKRDTLSAEEIPPAIQKMAQAAVTSQKFHYQPLPHKDLADDFLKFIRAAGDFTDPVSTVLAKLVTEYKGADGKTKKVTKGVMVRYSAGMRRGRKNGETETETDSTETETETKTEGTDAK